MQTTGNYEYNNRTGDVFLDLIHQEKKLHDKINQLLYSNYNPRSDHPEQMLAPIISEIKNCGLSEIANARNQIIQGFILIPEETKRDFLHSVLLGSQQYRNEQDIQKTIDLLISFFKKITPADSEVTGDYQAYCEYIGSIITRCALSSDLSTIAKMNSMLEKNKASIVIKGAQGCSVVTNKEESTDHKYKEKSNVIAQEILDSIYISNPKKFEQSAFVKGGIYKQGMKNPDSGNIQQLIIKIRSYDEPSFSACIDENNKVYPALVPLFMDIAHEEHHGIRMLRGATREDGNMPGILQRSYSRTLEEYANIRVAKKSDVYSAKIYGYPSRLSHYAGDKIEISRTAPDPDYKSLHSSMQTLLAIAMLESGEKDFSNFKDALNNFRSLDFTGYNLTGTSIEKSVKQNSNIEVSPLISKFFYNEGVDDLDAIQKFIDEYKKNNGIIPANQNPVHLLAQFSYLWDPAIEANQLKKQQLIEIFKRNGLDFDAEDGSHDTHYTPLNYAINAQDIRLVELILVYGDVKKFIWSTSEFVVKTSILSEAIETGNPKLIDVIFNYLKQDEHAHLLKEMLLMPFAGNPVMLAIKNHDTQLALDLLNYAASRGFIQEIAQNNSLLDLAARNSLLPVCQKLISSNPGLMQDDGVNVLYWALRSKNKTDQETTFQYLISTMKDPFNTRDQSGVTLLLRCAESHMLIDNDVFARVLNQARPALLFQVGNNKKNVLHLLMNTNKKIEMLLKYCEDKHIDISAALRQQDNNNKTPLEYYSVGCSAQFIKYIAQHCDLTNLNLANLHWENIDLSKARLAGSNMSGSHLVGANLAGADLVGVNFTGANLSQANLAASDLLKANLNNTKLDGTIFLGFSDFDDIKHLKMRLNYFLKVLDMQSDTSTKVSLTNALVKNIASNANRPSDAQRQGIVDLVYFHPLFSIHHNSELNSSLNSFLSFFSPKSVAIETPAQKQLTELFKTTPSVKSGLR